MKKKKMIVFAGILAAVGMLSTGCGKMTAEKLAARITEAEKEQKITAMTAELDMDGSYGMDVMGANISVDMNAQVGMTLRFSPDPIGAYVEMDMHMEAMEELTDQELQAYLTEEDGELAFYEYNKTNDLWSRTAVEMDRDSWAQAFTDMTFSGAENMEDLVLEEDLTEVDGREAYVLHGISVLDDEAFSEGVKYGFEFMMPEAENALSDFSMQRLEVPMTLYVDKETCLPLKIELDLSGMDEFINEVLDVVISEVLKEAEESMDISFGSIEMSLSKCDMTMGGFSVEPQEIPAVPEEAFDAIAFQEALEDLDPDLGDGSFALRSGAAAVKVTGPENMEMTELTEETVSFMDTNTMGTLAYGMAPAETESLYVESMESMYKEILEAAGYEVQTGKEEKGVTSAFGDLDGYWISGGGMSIYYTFAQVNGACLMVVKTDVAEGEPDAVSALNAALEKVTELTPEDVL